MVRRVFFSFHYERDVQRAHVVRNSWVTKPDREEAGFFDSSVFEGKKKTSDDALKRFLNEGLRGSSVIRPRQEGFDAVDSTSSLFTGK